MACKFYTVDRIEGDFAVLYDSGDHKSDIAVKELPEGLREGDILKFDEENNSYIIDKEQTAQVKATMEERFKKLFKKK